MTEDEKDSIETMINVAYKLLQDAIEIHKKELLGMDWPDLFEKFKSSYKLSYTHGVVVIVNRLLDDTANLIPIVKERFTKFLAEISEEEIIDK